MASLGSTVAQHSISGMARYGTASLGVGQRGTASLGSSMEQRSNLSKAWHPWPWR